MAGCLRTLRSACGSSPLEIMITAVSASILFGGLYGFYRSQVFALRAEQVAVSVKEDADVAMGFLVRELRLAGARPASRDADCSVPVAPIAGCADFEHIVAADVSGITVQYDFHDGEGGPADGCTDGRTERITYSYNAAARTIERAAQGVNDDQPAALAGNVPPGGFALEYRDLEGNPVPIGSGGLTALQRRSVARIRITVTSREEHPHPGIPALISTTRSSTVFLRNPGC